jgi:hypothetical protein
MLLVLSAASMSDAAVITVGNHVLVPNSGVQTIDILISGGEPMIGLDFTFSIGDGGVDFGGTMTEPLADVDLVGPGTIYHGNNTGQQLGAYVPGSGGTIVGPGLWGATYALTETGFIRAEGVLARLTIDTTDLSNPTSNDRVIPLRMTLPPGNPYGPVPTSFTGPNGLTVFPLAPDGSLIIPAVAIPEPAGLSLGLVSAAAVALVVRRSRPSRGHE